MRNVYNHVIFQLIHGLFQVPTLSVLPKVWIVLQQAPKRSRICSTQERVKQDIEDEKLQVSTVRTCNQRIVGILRCVEDSRAYNRISRLKSVILTRIFAALLTQHLRCIL